jgi:hypothetical protein
MHQISKIYFVIKLYMFRASSVAIIGSYLLYTQLGSFMQVVTASKQSQVGTAILQFQPDSARKWSHNLHETYQMLSVQ